MSLMSEVLSTWPRGVISLVEPEGGVTSCLVLIRVQGPPGTQEVQGRQGQLTPTSLLFSFLCSPEQHRSCRGTAADSLLQLPCSRAHLPVALGGFRITPWQEAFIAGQSPGTRSPGRPTHALIKFQQAAGGPHSAHT